LQFVQQPHLQRRPFKRACATVAPDTQVGHAQQQQGMQRQHAQDDELAGTASV